jgi:hypothetical protein
MFKLHKLIFILFYDVCTWFQIHRLFFLLVENWVKVPLLTIKKIKYFSRVLIGLGSGTKLEKWKIIFF